MLIYEYTPFFRCNSFHLVAVIVRWSSPGFVFGSRHMAKCPLLGVKRTSLIRSLMSANTTFVIVS